MGLSPKLWGAKAWHLIHSGALTYPLHPTENDKTEYRIFYESLSNVLPCAACASHYKDKLEKMPINLSSRQNLFKWTVDLHNDVNIHLGKPILSYQQAIDDLHKNNELYKEWVNYGTFAAAAVISAILTIGFIAVVKKT